MVIMGIHKPPQQFIDGAISPREDDITGLQLGLKLESALRHLEGDVVAIGRRGRTNNLD